MLFVNYPKCTTCKKAKAFLDSIGVPYEDRNIKEQNPTKEELLNWIHSSGLDIKRFFNTSGLIYRSLGLKDKLSSMSDEEKIQLLASDGMLVKRPILIDENKVLVGFNEKEWESLKQPQKG